VATVRARRAGGADAEAASAALADAFADYAWTRWTVDSREHGARIESLQRLVIERIALPYGEVWVADDESGRISSVAIWMPPGSSIPESVLEATAAAQAELEGDRHDASVRAEVACEMLRPERPHYLLGAVGTRSDSHRQGLATAVLTPMLDRAESEGAIVHLETSAADNVRFYERLGLWVTGEIDVPGGGPHVWAMARGVRPAG
jgi:GNAT superfamily N-acetyltransferase